MAKAANEEYEGVLSDENLKDLQDIYDDEQRFYRDQDRYPFYAGKRSKMELTWIAEMEQLLAKRKNELQDRTPLTQVFAAKKKEVNATTQSKVLRMLLNTISQYNLNDRRGHFLQGNAVKTFNPCGTRTCKERALHIREALTFLSMVPPEVLANMTQLDSYKRGFGSALGWSSTRKKTIDPTVAFTKPKEQYSSSGYNKFFNYYDSSTGDKELDKLWRKEKLKGTNDEVFKKIKGTNKGKYYERPDESEQFELKDVVNGKWKRFPEEVYDGTPVVAEEYTEDNQNQEPVHEARSIGLPPQASAQQRQPSAQQPQPSAQPTDQQPQPTDQQSQPFVQPTDQQSQPFVQPTDQQPQPTDQQPQPTDQQPQPTYQQVQPSAPTLEEIEQPNIVQEKQPVAPINDLEPALIEQGWSVHKDDQNRTYYYNKTTRSSHWEKPKLQRIPKPPEPSKPIQPLPKNWRLVQQPNDRPFYYNEKTDERTYEKPVTYKKSAISALKNGLDFLTSNKPIDGGTFRKKKQNRKTRRLSK
jgi:hypothetical protein